MTCHDGLSKSHHEVTQRPLGIACSRPSGGNEQREGGRWELSTVQKTLCSKRLMGVVPTTDGLAWLPPFLRPAFLRPTLWREAIVANASIEPWENVGAHYLSQ
jgi:hypothetical protein